MFFRQNDSMSMFVFVCEYMLNCTFSALLFVYVTQSYIYFQKSSPIKVLQFCALDGTVHMAVSQPCAQISVMISY